MFIHTFNVDISFPVDAIAMQSSEARNVIFLISVHCTLNTVCLCALCMSMCARADRVCGAVHHISNECNVPSPFRITFGCLAGWRSLPVAPARHPRHLYRKLIVHCHRH